MDNNTELLKMKQEQEIALFNANNQIGLSIITMGQNAIKSATLINGGAAVALLAFIGNVWDKGVAHNAALLLTQSVAFFAAGVLFASLGAGATYCCQHLLVSQYIKTGLWFQCLAIALVIVSYCMFGWASWSAYSAFIIHFLR
ncbi:hypothetical protein KIAC18_000322 [Sporomusa sphaeroides]|uniref:hypothetical protein n=1 Tax=Sporomusa sphaeroides TaxID=47679 RepID=UPI003DA0A790